MGIIDKAKEMLGGHTDAAKGGVDKVADKADDMTGKKYGDKIGRGADKLKAGLDQMHSRGAEGADQAPDRAAQAGDTAQEARNG